VYSGEEYARFICPVYLICHQWREPLRIFWPDRE
jgi:hypothetical protein